MSIDTSPSLLTRINVHIFKRQRTFFMLLKRKEGMAFAEALRRAIDDYIVKIEEKWKSERKKSA